VTSLLNPERAAGLGAGRGRARMSPPGEVALLSRRLLKFLRVGFTSRMKEPHQNPKNIRCSTGCLCRSSVRRLVSIGKDCELPFACHPGSAGDKCIYQHRRSRVLVAMRCLDA